MKRRVPALDGLRGIAVVAVLIYHGGTGWLRGGYLGVDVFFVLSGFLITSLLLSEHTRTGRVDLIAFWRRRARRLLPALALLLVGIVFYARLVAAPSEVASLRGDWIATVAYVANWRFVFAHQSYFAQFGAPSPLRHAWSLAVEEQFYLVWPFVVAGLMRSTKGRKSWLAVAFATGALFSAVEMALLAHPGLDPSRVYYGTDTRAQALLLGAALGVLLGDVSVRPAHAGRAIVQWLGGVAALLLCWFFVDGRETSIAMYRGGHTVVALATVAVIASAVSGGRTALNRALRVAPLKVLGRISYGLYLWHWPVDLVFDAQRTHLHPVLLLAVRLSITFALAIVSWAFVERPAMTGASLRVRRGVLLIAPSASVLAVVAMVLAPSVSALPFAPPPDPVALSSPQADATKLTVGASGSTSPAFVQTRRLLLVGDSVAETLGWGLQRGASQDGRALWDRGQLGCGLAPNGALLNGGIWQPVPSECATWTQQWQTWVAQIDPDVSIVVFDVWVVEDLKLNGRVLAAGSLESDHYLIDMLDRGVGVLRSRGGRVVLLTAPYNDRAASSVDPSVHREEDDPARIDHWNALLRAYAAQHLEAVQLADLNAFTAPRHRYTNTINGVRLRYDGVHFEPDAGALVYRWLAPFLSRR